ncbi:MAG TPA: hypothetical protein VH370_08765 [Humisphaera sp.]|jgi:hypothetical protein|nr:hypothetical protein [Humisphaera sp.]
METSGNVETINNLLNVETYLSLLMDVAVEQLPASDGSDERHEGEQMARLHERLSRRPID